MSRLEQAKNNLKVINQRNPRVRDGIIFRLLGIVDENYNYWNYDSKTSYAKFLSRLIKEQEIEYEEEILFDKEGHLVNFDYFYIELFCKYANRFQKQWVVFYPCEGQEILYYYHQLPWAVVDYNELIINKRIIQEVNLQWINYSFFILQQLYPKITITNPLLLDLNDAVEGALIELNFWMEKLFQIQYWDKIYIDRNGKVENLDLIVNLLQKYYMKAGNLNTPLKKRYVEMRNLSPKKNERTDEPFVNQFSFNDCKINQQNFQKNLQFENLLNNIDLKYEKKDQNTVAIPQSPYYKKLDGMTQSQIKFWNNEQLRQDHEKEMRQRKDNYYAELKNNGFYKSFGLEEKSFPLYNVNQDENRVNQSQRISNIFLNQSAFERSQFNQ